MVLKSPLIFRKMATGPDLSKKFHLSNHELMKNTKDWQQSGLKTYSSTEHPSDPEIIAGMKHNHQWWQKRISKF